ncbi:hypothetical protein AVEN_67132-1 [Araneus ventricosus]|uniref:Uncharacterized protein n=1 Tax=Araneus ventricosus TaxID=182803 RepID=A0A4Y2W3I6_ARAVE|nr:hypothetical protein AVEN_67132-1 [Araneus ventricosus]
MILCDVTSCRKRTVYYTGYTHKLEPRYTTVHRCCEGCFPIDDRGCLHKECLQELTELCDDPRMSYCSCDDRHPQPAHCEPPGEMLSQYNFSSHSDRQSNKVRLILTFSAHFFFCVFFLNYTILVACIMSFNASIGDQRPGQLPVGPKSGVA